MIRVPPTIKTARLALRPFRAQDFDAYREFRFTLDRTTGGAEIHQSEARAWKDFLGHSGHWDMLGYGVWAATELAGGRLIGEIGFHHDRRGLWPDFDSFPSLRCALRPEVRRQGLAREALSAAHDWYDRVIQAPAVVELEEDNAAALHAAEGQNYRAYRAVASAPVRIVLLRRDGPAQP